ncbi:S8 family serine peptidase [Nakamurella lactea]|uniref:S8 family serine peptidase n=1 Tax=Nakamurella lactea TaxID=459515 RepID=UPI000A00C779|nr:S8 family serine peptidase [Nakamurella lactea]
MTSRSLRGLTIGTVVALAATIAPTMANAVPALTDRTGAARATSAGSPAGAAKAAPDTPTTVTPAAATAADTGTTHSVTLITGDVVSVSTTPDGRTAATVQSAGSGGVQTQNIGKSLYVIPDSARPLLAANKLDRELFNVTKLVSNGYTDDQTGALPVIASYRGSAAARSVKRVPAGATKKRDLPSINASALQAKNADMAAFWSSVAPSPDPKAAPTALADNIGKIWLDGKAKSTLDVSVPQVGGPQAWAAGYTGTGTTVAVLDTGIDTSHPDLAGQIADTQSFVPGESMTDVVGHGTHVASTIAGTGAASDGLYKGVAPGAKLLVGKVLGDDGYGQDSWIIAGMEWAASKAKVVSMSLGDPTMTTKDDPMAQAVDRISEQTGALFVIAAGNAYGEGTVSSPGTADEALTIGAVDDNDVRADFSSMGPRGGDSGMKPDLSAPGVDITAARSKDSYGEGMYTTMSGTSMATPHVAGAAAIVLQAHPDWTASQVKDALMSGSTELAGTTPYQVGSGRLWIPDAIDNLRATGSDFFGYYTWPHDGDDPVTKTVTYTNTGDAPVTLSLSADAAGPDGAALTGLFTLSADTVTVPANGTAEVSVTADADDASGTGQFTGEINATDATGKVAAHTAVALAKEDERYDLDLSAVGRNGKPAGGFVELYRFGDWSATLVPVDPATGKAQVQRVQPGIYNVTSWLPVAGTDGPDSAGIALLGNPHLVIGADTDLVLDARKATKISVATPKAGTVATGRRLQFFHDSGLDSEYRTYASTYQPGPEVDDLFAAPTGAVAGGQYDFAVRYRLTAPPLQVSATGGVGKLDPLYYTGSRHLDGKLNLPVAVAGSGTPDDYVGVWAKGAAAVITRSDAVSTSDAVAAAEHAGAALLVVVNDRPGKFVDYTFTDLPVVSLTAAQGARLVKAAQRKRITLRGTAIEFSPYLYDLSKSYPNGIPANLSWKPAARELATVSERFIGKTDGLAFENRYDCRSYQWPPCLGFFTPQGLGRNRVDYVSTEPGNAWYQDVVDLNGWEQRFDQVDYRPRERTSLDWFAPITRPVLGPGYWGPFRGGDVMQVNVPTAGGPGVTGAGGDTVVSRLFQNGELIKESPFQAIQDEVPHVDGPATYRFEQDTTRPAELSAWSSSTHSEWTFDSQTPSDPTVKVLLPLLQLNYDVAVDLGGYAKAGSRATIGLSTWQQPDAVGIGSKVRSATLELSYDGGASWQRASLHRSGNHWSATVRYPKSGATSVSIRASAADNAGNTVHQEIIKAFGLR